MWRIIDDYSSAAADAYGDYWTERVRRADSERRARSSTPSLWFECGGSNTEVAQRLHYHRNTIHFRLRRIETRTDRRCSDPKAAAEPYAALTAARLARPDPA
ncbi:helix-turn-helix domain-containing protein [Nocardia sp. NPDC052112]|uniref:helix-turn-helix domain-containing protein n=1 Tax=Nocardia sp. NPDC052112 TaxID=3155646 RepID=UPI0034312251